MDYILTPLWSLFYTLSKLEDAEKSISFLYFMRTKDAQKSSLPSKWEMNSKPAHGFQKSH